MVNKILSGLDDWLTPSLFSVARTLCGKTKVFRLVFAWYGSIELFKGQYWKEQHCHWRIEKKHIVYGKYSSIAWSKSLLEYSLNHMIWYYRTARGRFVGSRINIRKHALSMVLQFTLLLSSSNTLFSKRSAHWFRPVLAVTLGHSEAHLTHLKWPRDFGK